MCVASDPEAACVLMKKAVAITGLPKLSNIVTEVDELKVAGFLGSKSSADAKTVEDAGKLIASSKLSVFLASPASNSSFKGCASVISPP